MYIELYFKLKRIYKNTSYFFLLCVEIFTIYSSKTYTAIVVNSLSESLWSNCGYRQHNYNYRKLNASPRCGLTVGKDNKFANIVLYMYVMNFGVIVLEKSA